MQGPVGYMLLTFALVCFAASGIFEYLSSANTELFNNATRSVDIKYYQHIKPGAIVFSIIWPVIYIWNALGILYLVATAFIPKKLVRMSPVNMTPTLTQKRFLLAYSVTFLTRVGWLFAYDAEIIGLSFALVLLGTVTSYITVGFSYKRIQANLSTLEARSNVTLWLMRILIQNGLCVLAAWLTFATFINLADLIIYEDSFFFRLAQLRGTLSLEDGSTIAFALLLVCVFVWFILENFVWEIYCRYTLTIYPVFILGYSGIIAKLRFITFSFPERNLIITSVELAVVVIAFLVRIGLLIYKIKTRGSATA